MSVPGVLYLLIASGACAATFFSLPFWREWSRRTGLMDEPGARKQHRGAMPAQLDANLRTLDRFQKDLNSIDDSIKSAELTQAEERKNAAEERRALQDLMLSQSAATTSALQPQPLDPKLQAPPRLEALKQELARLRGTFNENYPDIVSTHESKVPESRRTNPIEPQWQRQSINSARQLSA